MNTAIHQPAGHHAPSLLRRIPSAVGYALAGIAGGIVAIGQANPRLREFERLSGLSDAELGARGLSRDHLVHHVFRGSSFL